MCEEGDGLAGGFSFFLISFSFSFFFSILSLILSCLGRIFSMKGGGAYLLVKALGKEGCMIFISLDGLS